MAKTVKKLAAKPKGSKQVAKPKAAPKSAKPVKSLKPVAKPPLAAAKDKNKAEAKTKAKAPVPVKGSGKTFAPTKAAKDSVTKNTKKSGTPKSVAPQKSLPVKSKSVPKPTNSTPKPDKSTKPASDAKAAAPAKSKAPAEKPAAPAKTTAAKPAAPAAKAVESTKAAAPVKASAAKAPESKAAPAAKATTGKASKKPASAPAPAPEPLPRIKKITISDAPPEIVIKQAYNPAKLPPFVRKQQQRLYDLRSALLDSMDGVAKETLRSRPEGSDASVGGMHMGDAGSDAYDRDFALSMLSKEQDALYEINEALKRLDGGVYGVCELSGQKISEERLEALPYTRYTRDMQEQIERDQIGGRFRRPVVRSVFGLDDENEEDDDDEEEGSSSSSSNNESSLDFSKE